MNKNKCGRRYDEEFKRNAVDLLISSGKTATELGRELGVTSWTLSQWKKQRMGGNWQPRIPLRDLQPQCIERATKLQKILSRYFEPSSDKMITAAERDKIALKEYARLFGHSITTRHLRRLIQRTKDRDRGVQNWQRLELYLDENISKRPQKREIVAQSQFENASLMESIGKIKNPSRPNSKEKLSLWTKIFIHLSEKLEQGESKPRAKKSILIFLEANAPFLARSAVALRRNFDRKFERWIAGNQCPSAIADQRPKKSGHFRAPALPAEDKSKLIARSVQLGGRESQAWRELQTAHEFGPEISTYYLENSNKSYVPHKIREAVTSKVNLLKEIHHGPRQAKLNGAYIERDPSFASGDWFQADDCTLPNYYYELTPEGIQIMRGQFLAMIDCRSTYILSFVLISERNYNAKHIRNLISVVADAYGLPRSGFYFENGTWRARLIVGRRPEVDWDDTELGLRDLGMQFRHAELPRAKIVERVLGACQNYLEAEPGYAGRDERHDRFERLQQKLSLARRGKLDPASFLLSKEQWIERLTVVCGKYNDEVQNGKRLNGLSPKEAYQKFFTTPLVHLPDSCRYLLAHNKLPVRIGRNGISFQLGKERYTYKNERTGQLKGQKVLAWFNPENPDLLSVTDLNQENPFTVERSLIVPEMDATPEVLEEAMAQNEQHDAYAKALYRAITPYFAKPFAERMFRPCAVDQHTAALGQTMKKQQTAILQAKKEEKQTQTRVSKLAAEMNLPINQLNRRSLKEAEEGAKLMQQAKAMHHKQTPRRNRK